MRFAGGEITIARPIPGTLLSHPQRRSRQFLRGRFQKVGDRLFLAAFERRQYNGFPSIVARADNGGKITMPFEQRDFIQSDLAQMFELVPIGFASDVSVEQAARTIVRNARYLIETSLKKIGEGFRASF
ncbi:MAG TPA: hypothetical protein VIM99_10160 [Blastocatellia bacterium]